MRLWISYFLSLVYCYSQDFTLCQDQQEDSPDCVCVFINHRWKHCRAEKKKKKEKKYYFSIILVVFCQLGKRLFSLIALDLQLLVCGYTATNKSSVYIIICHQLTIVTQLIDNISSDLKRSETIQSDHNECIQMEIHFGRNSVGSTHQQLFLSVVSSLSVL